MEESNNSINEERIQKDTPQLVRVLREMKEGLDKVTAKVQDLTAKVKANKNPTADGISYLEAKHLLLLSYCQSLVYYLLRKAEGLSIDGHPVVRSLIEMRLFLEKIRPIDKKMQYQIQKLTRLSGAATEGGDLKVKESGTQEKTEDLLRYRPNPDMLASKTDAVGEDGTGVYKPPKFAPALMDEEKMSKQEKNALRKEKETLRGARQSDFVRELMNDMEGKPEEYREEVGTESRELMRYRSKIERRAAQEEELFTRTPLTRVEKKRGKHLLKSRNGLLGLSDGFYDEIKSLPMDENDREQSKGFSSGGGMRKQKKFKRKH